MAFSSESIAKVVNRLNTQYFLPAIQREFVWRPDQIVQLFDSLMRRYPVGSFLFWELQPENRDKWQVYKFVEDAKQGGSHNVLANAAGVQQLTLVLDGQQRLTSVLVGLKGSYTIKNAIERAITLVNTFGVDRDTLTSANALIPLVYYLYQHPNTSLLGTTPFDVRNANLIRRWLLGALLNNAFSGSSDSALTDTRKTLQATPADSDFPADALNRQLSGTGRSPEFNEYAIDDFLSITYGSRDAFLALSLLYDESNWGVVTYHLDHIFPRAQFTTAKLESAGIPAERRWRYQNLANRLGNLQLLAASENIGKSDQDFSDWLRTRDASFRVRHLIPADDTLLDLNHFEEFIEAREELIRHRIRSLFGLTTETPTLQAFDRAVA